MIQYILSYRCIMDPTTVCLDGCPHLQMGAAFLYGPAVKQLPTSTTEIRLHKRIFRAGQPVF